MGPMNELDRWVTTAAGVLGLRPEDVQTKAVLDVARDVAHQVLRPGAPVTAYLMGVAVGRGADPADAAARISALALDWHGGEQARQDQGRVREGMDQRGEGTDQLGEGTDQLGEGTDQLGEGMDRRQEGMDQRGEDRGQAREPGLEDQETVADPPTP
jgi:hypothetical protein